MLETRSLKEHEFCALFLDGMYFQKRADLCARPDFTGAKIVLGLRQGATENATVVRQLLEDLQERGLDFSVPRLYVLDGGKALAAALRKVAGRTFCTNSTLSSAQDSQRCRASTGRTSNGYTLQDAQRLCHA